MRKKRWMVSEKEEVDGERERRGGWRERNETDGE